MGEPLRLIRQQRGQLRRFRAEVTEHLDNIIAGAPPELVIEFLRDSAAMILTSMYSEDPLHARQLLSVYSKTENEIVERMKT